MCEGCEPHTPGRFLGLGLKLSGNRLAQNAHVLDLVPRVRAATLNNVQVLKYPLCSSVEA